MNNTATTPFGWPLLHPAESRRRARENAKAKANLCSATTTYVVPEDQLVLTIPPRRDHRLDNVLGSFLHHSYPSEFPEHLDSTDIMLEDLGARRRNGHLLRMVLRGRPVAETDMRYDGPQFIFLLSPTPVVLDWGKEELGHRHAEDPDARVLNRPMTPSFLAGLTRQANSMVVLFEQHRIHVRGLFHGGKVHRTRHRGRCPM
ncbi:MAG: hypothetical protein GC159_16295 [Phycisphaera sp.]|nr:hypothetical protein [Phycisphaera sp.]